MALEVWAIGMEDGPGRLCELRRYEIGDGILRERLVGTFASVPSARMAVPVAMRCFPWCLGDDANHVESYWSA